MGDWVWFAEAGGTPAPPGIEAGARLAQSCDQMEEAACRVR